MNFQGGCNLEKFTVTRLRIFLSSGAFESFDLKKILVLTVTIKLELRNRYEWKDKEVFSNTKKRLSISSFFFPCKGIFILYFLLGPKTILQFFVF